VDAWEESGPIRAKPAPSHTTGPSTSDDKDSKARKELLHAVFRACDLNGDDWLSEGEFRNIANFYGFKGDSEKWAEEFKKLCEEHRANPNRGISFTMFTNLLNDQQGGLHADMDDLQKMLRKLQDHKQKVGGTAAAKNQGAAPADGEGDEFFQKLKRTVHWYNKHGQLVEQIRLNAVHEHLSEIKPSQAMKILYDLDQQAKETLTDPTGWIINQAKLRKQANETKGKGDGKGEKDSDRDHKGNNKTEGKAEAASKDAVPEWRSQKSEELDEKNSKSGNKGAGKGKADEGEEQETDEFRAKMKRTINWYNRHGGLLAPIRFQEVIQTLGMTDPRVAMRILNDLDQANAEAVLQDPTKWIIEECRRRVAGDKGAPNSQTSGTRVSATNEVPQPKPLALSKLGGLTAVPTRLGPPKKDAAAAVPAGSP